MSTLHKDRTVSKKILWQVKKIVKAVDDVSLEIHAGSSMALIGESGSGENYIRKADRRPGETYRWKILVSGTGNAGFV